MQTIERKIGQIIKSGLKNNKSTYEISQLTGLPAKKIARIIQKAKKQDIIPIPNYIYIGDKWPAAGELAGKLKISDYVLQREVSKNYCEIFYPILQRKLEIVQIVSYANGTKKHILIDSDIWVRPSFLQNPDDCKQLLAENVVGRRGRFALKTTKTYRYIRGKSLGIVNKLSVRNTSRVS